MARGRSFRGHTSSVAHKQWVLADDSLTAIDLAEGTQATGTTGLVANVPITVLRIRGLIGAQLDPGATDERVLLLFGLIVVPVPAFNVGGVSMPGPVSEDSDDWIWQGGLWLTVGAEAGVAQEGSFGSLEIDTKAMRKMKPDEVMALVVQVAESVDQAGTFDAQYYFRMLLGN